MSSILNNTSAIGASRQLGLVGIDLGRTIQRLTTGKRINQASDDAAGLAIANKLGADIKISGQAQRNANDGVSYLQVADGALDSVTTLLTRASQLAQQAQTGTISDSNRANLDAEFQNILKTIINIGQSTKFNGQTIFSTTGGTGAVSVQAGDYGSLTSNLGSLSSSATDALGFSTTAASTTTSVTTPGTPPAGWILGQRGVGYVPPDAVNDDYSSTGGVINAYIYVDTAGDPVAGWPPAGWTDTGISLGVDGNGYLPSTGTLDWQNGSLAEYVPASVTTTTTTTGTSGDSLLTASKASSAAARISAALESVSSMRASIGASETQLTATSDILGVQVQNFTAARSQIEDTDVSSEVVNLTRFQILNQSGTSALSKSNQASQQILALLQ